MIGLMFDYYLLYNNVHIAVNQVENIQLFINVLQINWYSNFNTDQKCKQQIGL